jgi:hypothetical protein
LHETNPQGWATQRRFSELRRGHPPFGADFEESGDGQTIFFDVNADAVRHNDEVPDRPIRLTFERAGERGGKYVWRLKSVAELAPGVASRALDRQPETPKRNARWPD